MNLQKLVNTKRLKLHKFLKVQDVLWTVKLDAITNIHKNYAAKLDFLKEFGQNKLILTKKNKGQSTRTMQLLVQI